MSKNEKYNAIFKRLLGIFKRRHECEFIVLGVADVSVGKDRTRYGIAMCKHFLCHEKIYFPQEYRAIHERWIKEGKNVVESFERNLYINYD